MENPESLEEKQTDLAPRWTTMKDVGSALAVMFIENVLRKGGRIKFAGIDIELTRENLERSKNTSSL